MGFTIWHLSIGKILPPMVVKLQVVTKAKQTRINFAVCPRVLIIQREFPCVRPSPSRWFEMLSDKTDITVMDIPL